MNETIKDAESNIQEAEVSEIKNEEVIDEKISENKSSRKKKIDFYVELVLFLILGVLLGIAIKTEAVKRVTMGFDDYKMKMVSQDYNINSLQAKILEKQRAEAELQEEAAGQQNSGENANQPAPSNAPNNQ